MVCTKKSKLEEELEHIPLEEEIKEEMVRIIEEMNYDDAIPERIYDPVEEERRIREGEISRAKRLGKKEGKEEESKIIARNLLNNKIDMDIISASTGLSKEEIEKL